MHLQMQLGQRLQQGMVIQLTMGQKVEMKLRLIEAVRGENVRIKFDCGGLMSEARGCGYKLTAEELIKGFTRDPNDTTTVCPRCERRFQPMLRFLHATDSGGEVNFMCANQAKHRLEARGDLYARQTPDEIRRAEAALYYSLVFHYGTLKKAFSEIGIDYSAKEFDDWAARIRPFLGEVPDTLIAEVSGVKAHQVSALRKKLKIESFNKRHIAEAEE